MEENKEPTFEFCRAFMLRLIPLFILIAALPYSLSNFVVMISVAPAGELITKFVLFISNIVTVWFSFSIGAKYLLSSGIKGFKVRLFQMKLSPNKFMHWTHFRGTFSSRPLRYFCSKNALLQCSGDEGVRGLTTVKTENVNSAAAK